MPVIPQSPFGSNDPTPMPKHSRSQTANDATQPTPTLNTIGTGDYFTMRTRQPNAGPAGVGTPDEFKHDGGVPQTPLTPGGGLMGRLKHFGKASGKKGPGDLDPTSPSSKPIAIPDPKLEVRVGMRH